jgi:hemerythrin-like metal-binding protein
MSALKWDKHLELGIERVDSQHKMLVKIVNAWLRAVENKRDARVIDNVIRRLREYTVYHFNDEEAFMEEIDYPDLYEHRQEHLRLKQQVKDYQRNIYKHENITTNELRDFLTKWLIAHVLGSDMAIGNYLKSKNKKSS